MRRSTHPGPRPLHRLAAMAGIAAHWVMDLVVPPLCAACEQRTGSADSLCPSCWREVTFIRPPLCDRLGHPLPFGDGGTVVSAAAMSDPPIYDRARAVAEFGPVMRDLVHGFKYGDRHHARHLFGRWLVMAGGELLSAADLLVPVPLHRWRLLQRRFNQAAVLAGEVSRLTGIPADPLIVERARRTRSQVGLTGDQRRRNVTAAFAIAPDRAGRLLGRRVVLVDDVITTGATADACARALKSAGAASVDVLALALVTDRTQISL